MTETRRIFLNVIATYGRSLFSLACGLFSGRWALMALGHEDYGLWGVVGGLTSFVSFFNDLLSNAVGRFYAVAVGKAQKGGTDDLEVCRQWFNMAVSIHTVLPVVLLIVGYPLGIWVIRDFLAIPLARMEPCVWVWRFVCLTCFINMVNAPFRAMYVAKQYIAELTVYSVIQTAANVVVLYYMVEHPGDWLSRYAFWSCLVASVPQVVICLRALRVFPECKFVARYLWDGKKARELGSFVLYHFFGTFAQLMQSQGTAIVVNKYLGARSNATVAIGRTVSSQATTLSASLNSALWPAIASAAGAKDYGHMRNLATNASKIGTLLILVFALPLAVEVDTVMALWLKNPPPDVSYICLCVLVTQVLDRLTSGNWMVVFAMGQIKRYQFEISLCFLIGFLMIWGAVAASWGIRGVGHALIALWLLISIIRVLNGRRIAHLSVRAWAKGVLAPTVFISGACLAVGLPFHSVMPASFGRVVLSSSVVLLAFLPLAWFIVLTAQEREFVGSRLASSLQRVVGRKEK